MTFLLDVNVFIALIDPDHSLHDIATAWFEREGNRDWATCPIVENGVIRIVGAATYADPPLSCATVAETVAAWCAHRNHRFWPDELSLVASSWVDRAKLLSPGRITDTYLLALAASRGGKLATLDRRLATVAVPNGADALAVIA